MTDSHILKSFDDAMNQLLDMAVSMGHDVITAVDDTVAAYIARDQAKAREIIRLDLKIDRQHDTIKDAVVNLLVRHQPVATDLREVLAAEHVASNLERIADHAKSIAKRTLANDDPVPQATTELVTALHASVAQMLKTAVDALENRNIDLARTVVSQDRKSDEIYEDLFHSIIADIRARPDHVAEEVHSLFVGKSLERIGDHATNISEEVMFVVRGEYVPSTRTK